MADYRTEEEQIQLLKAWWKENGKSTLAGIVLALSGYAGWVGWSNHQQSTIAAAADVYQDMQSAIEAPERASDAKVLAESLRKDHAGTVYSIFAALYLARDAVESKDLPRAAELLLWARDQKPDDGVLSIVSLRLAQVCYAQGEMEKALDALKPIKPSKAWDVSVAELRGDILLAQGKQAEARDSYNAAIKALDESPAQERRSDLEMKVSNLAAVAVGESS